MEDKQKTFKEKLSDIFDNVLDKVGFLSFVRILIILVLFFICTVIVQKCMISKQDKEIHKNENIIKALEDSVKVVKDSKGRTHTSIETIVGVKPEEIVDIKSDREDIQHLQSIIKEYEKALSKIGSSATVTKPLIKFDSVLKTDQRSNQILGDSILQQKIDSKWVQADYGFKKDSTWLKFKTFDRLALVNIYERANMFSKYKMKSELISENPLVEYEYLKGWSNTDVPDKKWIIGPSIILGIDKNLQFNYIIGGGIMYKLGSF